MAHKFDDITQVKVKEQRNANGVFIRPLHVQQFELEYWGYIKELMDSNPDLKSVADVMRHALKKATGRV